MAEFRSDDEQMDVIKRWWGENGTSLLIGVAVIGAVWLGSNLWDNAQAADRLAAAELHQSFTVAVEADDPESRDTALYLAEQLQAEHSGTGYVALAQLQLARVAVVDGDLPKAEERLREAEKSAESDALADLARLRLARVLQARGNSDDALATLDRVVLEGFVSERDELRGDIHVELGNHEDALSAYENAFAVVTDPETRPLLRQKRDAIR